MTSEGESSDDENQDYEIKYNSQVFTKLTTLVRGQYLRFLEKQLEENVRTWQEDYMPNQTRIKGSIEKSIKECLKIFDDMAIKEAILAQLYQRAMIRTISVVKESTKNRVLVKQLEESLKCNERTSKGAQTVFSQDEVERTCTVSRTYVSATTQTVVYYSTKETQTERLKIIAEKEPILSLEERIDLFQDQLKNGITYSKNPKLKPSGIIENQRSKRRRLNSEKCFYLSHHPLPSSSSSLEFFHSPTPPPKAPLPSTTINREQNSDNFDIQLEDDEIAQELDKLFTEDEPDLEEIFGIKCSNYKSAEGNLENKSTEGNLYIENSSELVLQNPINETVTKDLSTPAKTTVAPNPNIQQFPLPVKDLRYSIWPCECFMQKRRLSLTLNRIIEEDIRWYDILKSQFSILFGDDESMDDFAPCSPSIELDDVLKNSCMRRISPWVVRHLMKPLNDRLIGNRFVFKKLAKKIAYHIIMENQYPDEHFIKNVIENFFCVHQAVMTAEDLDAINMMYIIHYDYE